MAKYYRSAPITSKIDVWEGKVLKSGLHDYIIGDYNNCGFLILDSKIIISFSSSIHCIDDTEEKIHKIINAIPDEPNLAELDAKTLELEKQFSENATPVKLDPGISIYKYRIAEAIVDTMNKVIAQAEKE